MKKDEVSGQPGPGALAGKHARIRWIPTCRPGGGSRVVALGLTLAVRGGLSSFDLLFQKFLFKPLKQKLG